MIIFEEPEVDAKTMLQLKPCYICKKLKVLKEGDYCISCASVAPKAEEPRYYEVKPRNIDELVRRTPFDKKFLTERQESAFVRYCTFVVFRTNDGWKHVMINNSYNVKFVMQNILKRLG